MPQVEWYYTDADRRYGPVNSAQLKQLAERGALGPDSLVWREGMEDWTAARKVNGLFDAEPAKADASAIEGTATKPNSPAPAIPEPAVATAPPRSAPAAFERSSAAFERARERNRNHLFDYVLEAARRQLHASFVAGAARLFNLLGHYGLYAAMLAVLALFAAMALQTQSLVPALVGLAAVAALAVLQYAASRFSGALERLSRATSGRVATTALFDCFALTSCAAGLAALFGLSVVAVLTDSPGWTLPAAAGFIFFQYLAILALNPELLGLMVSSEVDLTEEALGLLLFLSQMIVRAVPVAMTLGIAWACADLIYATVVLFREPSAAAVAAQSPFPVNTPSGGMLAGAFSGGKAVLMLFGAAALPIAAYFFLLLMALGIGVLRTVAVLPDKLELLAERLEERKGD